ncbi:hypothetical protein MLD38_030597 [Melastoma candidum]|uniref:Uncharacterized protein n=1 Tax=Melastoma candidum TaxID=119954 RepID=A0ACB9MM64_9MYRT|nr:hypothetical protein MLD38_030597 [Melastoma candidum]
MKKPTSASDKLLASSTSRSSTVGTKKRPLASHDNSFLSVLRPKVYIIDSSSFKQLVQELTGKESPSMMLSPLPSPSSSLSSSSPHPLPSIIALEDKGLAEDILTSSEDNSAGQISPRMSPDTNSMPPPCDMDYVPFSASTNYKGFDFSYEDIESWLLEMDPVTSGSTSHGMEPVDVSIYDYDFS